MGLPLHMLASYQSITFAIGYLALRRQLAQLEAHRAKDRVKLHAPIPVWSENGGTGGMWPLILRKLQVLPNQLGKGVPKFPFAVLTPTSG